MVFFSGTLTTSIALSVFVYLMMEHPNLQTDLQNEASGHVRADTPSGEHRRSMPLMEATILEILRYISHVPLGLPHFTLRDTTIGGYRIPKNTQVRKLYKFGHSSFYGGKERESNMKVAFRLFLMENSSCKKTRSISFENKIVLGGELDFVFLCQVLLNLWAAHHDPDVWAEPWSFNPRRFLDDSGQLLPSDHPQRKR